MAEPEQFWGCGVPAPAGWVRGAEGCVCRHRAGPGSTFTLASAALGAFAQPARQRSVYFNAPALRHLLGLLVHFSVCNRPGSVEFTRWIWKQ